MKNTAHSRHSELKDVVERLFEQHDNSHLDEEVCQTTAGMALQDKQNTSEGLYCGADMLYNWLKIQWISHLLKSPSSNTHIIPWMAVYPSTQNINLILRFF